eukprot:gene26595-33197_t
MKDADIILFLLDAKVGVTSVDESFAKWLRKRVTPPKEKNLPALESLDQLPINLGGREGQRIRSAKDIILIANKTEGAHLSDRVLDTVAEGLRLGFGEPILLSASHGDGMADLAQVLIKAAQERGLDDGDEIVGRRLKLNKREFQTVIANSSGDETRDVNNRLLLSSESGSIGGGEITGEPSSYLSGEECNEVDSNLFNEVENEVVESSLVVKGGEKISKVQDLNHDGLPVKAPIESRLIQVAIMGRPNVGKSTLLNAIMGQERVITGSTPGLTRDSVHVEWSFGDRNFRLVDTAGLTRMRPNKTLMEGQSEKRHLASSDKIIGNARNQKKLNINKAVRPDGSTGTNHLPGIGLMDKELDPSQFSYQISEFALISALNALRFAQVVMLVIESKQGVFSKLELQLARKCLNEGRALIICANKMDLLKADHISKHEYEMSVKKHTETFMREFGDVPVVPCSGTEGNGINRLLETVISTHDAWSKRINTGLLNNWLKDLMVTAPTPRAGNKRINIKYITQIKTRPPTFALFGNVAEIPGFFERFLKSRMQRDFKLEGIPLRYLIRKTKGHAVKKRLLSQGKHTRRGVGHGERRGQGPNRELKMIIRKQRGQMNVRRKRDSRTSKSRKPVRSQSGH